MRKLQNSSTNHIHQNCDAKYNTPTTMIAICNNSENTVIAAFCDRSFTSFPNILCSIIHHNKKIVKLLFLKKLLYKGRIS